MNRTNPIESNFFELGNIGFSITTLNGIFVKMNQSFCDMFGYTCEELEKINWDHLLHYKHLKKDNIDLNECLSNDNNGNFFERTAIKKDGSHFNLLLSKTFYVDKETNEKYIFYSCQDITKQKEVETELFEICKEKEKELRIHIALEEKLRREKKELESILILDELTGAYNRNFVLNHINETIQQEDNSFSIIMCDIDNFKKINDLYGHFCGDYVLQKTVEIISNICRKEDYLSRWGGEEFLLYLPNTSIKEAKKIAERIRIRVANNPIVFEEETIQITLTLGVCEYDYKKDLSEVLQKADFALLEGKQDGKNRVVIC